MEAVLAKAAQQRDGAPGGRPGLGMRRTGQDDEDAQGAEYGSGSGRRPGYSPRVLDADIITAEAELAAIEPEWEGLAEAAGLPFMSAAWVRAWWSAMAPAGARPRVVAVRDRARLVAVAPFYVEPAQTRRRVDYRLPCIDLGAGLAPVARPGEEWAAAAAVAARLDEAAPRPDLVALEGMPVSSPWPLALGEGWPSRVSPVLRRYAVMGRPTVSLAGGSFDAWLKAKSSNFRSQMLRARRRFAAADGVERVATAATLAEDVATFMRLHALRWEELGDSTLVGYGDRVPRLLLQAGRALVGTGRFRLRVLELGGEPIAAQLFLAAGGEVVYVNGGWDPRHAQLKPSMIGLLGAIEHAFAAGDRRVDLGLGEQSYKLRFADGVDHVAWSVLLVPGRRLPLTAARTAPMLVSAAARRAAKRALTDEQAQRLRRLRARRAG